jgi:hypothetical protein
MRRAIFAALLPALLPAGPAAAQLNVDKRADLSASVVIAPGQAAIVVGISRPDPMSVGKSATIAFGRYDIAMRDIILQPRGAKKAGDTTTYSILVRSVDKKAAREVAVMLVSPGDYMVSGAVPGPDAQVTNTFCLGAPVFHVEAGEVVYFGDVTPYLGVKLVDGRRISAMAYSSNLEAVRTALVNQPTLAGKLRGAEVRNGATYTCFAQTMTAYVVPGVTPLPPIVIEQR